MALSDTLHLPFASTHTCSLCVLMPAVAPVAPTRPPKACCCCCCRLLCCWLAGCCLAAGGGIVMCLLGTVDLLAAVVGYEAPPVVAAAATGDMGGSQAQSGASGCSWRLVRVPGTSPPAGLAAMPGCAAGGECCCCQGRCFRALGVPGEECCCLAAMGRGPAGLVLLCLDGWRGSLAWWCDGCSWLLASVTHTAGWPAGTAVVC